MLFEKLPQFPHALPDDELRLLSSLPEWDVTQELSDEEHAPARRLEKRGLIKIQRHKMDTIAIAPTWFAGKLTALTLAALGKVPTREGEDRKP